MKDIHIAWLTDHHDCETCGSSYAEGARVTVDGVVAFELIPIAHCFGGHHWDEDEVYRQVFALLDVNLSTSRG